jgi:chorismate mutase
LETLLDTLHISEWFDQTKHAPVIISGPCSAETEQQVIDTAMQLNSIERVSIFRAGLWKPRSRPDSFEGVGSIGFEWLKRVKEETKLLIAVEVATPEHVEECLKNNIDILWVGARTSSNPFSVQELANSLRGIDIPILVKNPINPDSELWIGALERFNKSGTKRIAAVHRGFYPFEKTLLRNIPKWEIPIELKTRYNNLTIICDPSHISGAKEFIFDISQKALDLNFDGLMIECHINPKRALSDSKQQITPAQLKKLLNELKFRTTSSENIEFNNLLEQLRNKIDSIDNQMLELLSQRMKIVEEIGKYKSENNVTILQLRRWSNLINDRLELCKKLNLSESFINKILTLVHEESIKKQIEILNSLKLPPLQR